MMTSGESISRLLEAKNRMSSKEEIFGLATTGIDHQEVPNSRSSSSRMRMLAFVTLLTFSFSVKQAACFTSGLAVKDTGSSMTKLGSYEFPGKRVMTRCPLFRDKTANDPEVNTLLEWEVYVDQSKASLERGAGATLDALLVLSPPSRVRVLPAVFSKPKVKGPIVRCVPLDEKSKDCLEVSNVDSVDKVFRILTRHMRVPGVNATARECLKWKYIGNGHLEEGETSRAIEAYDKALDTKFSEEEGIILLMRATAYLQRASKHKQELKRRVSDLSKAVPNMEKLQMLYEEAALFPALSGAMFERVVSDAKLQDEKFRKIKYRHGLYQYALLHAAQDSLRANQLLPAYSKSWLRAGEILSELWKLNESAKYYEKAIEMDSSLEGTLSPVVERLRKRQELLVSARAYGWSEDTLRLALDVAG